MTTISVEDYLKTIYHLEQRDEQGRVKTKEIADALEISLPSVTSMLKSLAESDLVTYERYRGAQLTQAGRKLALNVVRKHRLIEVFLVQTLSYTWDEVHAEAERLEHAISDDLAARIDRALGHPRFDPHGDPIPDADGVLPTRDEGPALALESAPRGQPLQIVRVLDQDPEILRYLERVGLIPGTSCQIDEVLAFDGTMFLSMPHVSAPITISRALAARLMVIAS